METGGCPTSFFGLGGQLRRKNSQYIMMCDVYVIHSSIKICEAAVSVSEEIPSLIPEMTVVKASVMPWGLLSYIYFNKILQVNRLVKTRITASALLGPSPPPGARTPW